MKNIPLFKLPNYLNRFTNPICKLKIYNDALTDSIHKFLIVVFERFDLLSV